MTTSKVLSWCREQALFPVGATVTAALSGGADSVAMLHLLLSLRGELGITLRAAHYNHHLRGEASEEDEDFCRALCRSLDVPLRCGGGDVAAFARERKISLELAARKLRYAFLLAGNRFNEPDPRRGPPGTVRNSSQTGTRRPSAALPEPP